TPMCEGGINTGQMKLAVAMVNDTLALAQQHLEQLHHLADHGHRTDSSIAIAQASVLLGEARAKLETGVNGLDSASSDGVHVELV
ncbi:MAG: hypothetical protein U1E22_02370, partial [Coriobacteriia bacterium]|nr:hypothetical protein [Coriobacteriia bacterium]